MTTLLQCIQAAKQAAKRKAPAQAQPAATLDIISVEHLTSLSNSQRISTAVAHPANTPASLSPSARAQDTDPSVSCERLGASEIISHQSQRCDTLEAHAHPISADEVGMLLPDPPETEMPAFTAKEFYGAPRLTAVELRVQRFLSHVRQRLSTVGHPFEVFPLQAKAFDFADDHELSELLRVFSVETGPKGARRFIATSYAEFWRRYQDIPPKHRHHYEIIRQGCPCHLYFDLEYARPANSALDGDRLVDTVLSLTAELLLARFGLTLDMSWVMELDSTTEIKLSRHLIVLIPGSAFASNAHVGAFVQELCALAESRREEQSTVAELFVKKESGEDDMFIDRSVYTRNRSFRLFLSSKAGKEAVLMPTSRLAPASRVRKQVFMGTLICNVPTGACLLRCGSDDEEVAGQGLASDRSMGSRMSHAAAVAGQGPSPYPRVDEYLHIMASQGGVQGSIRSWVELSDVGVVIYNISGNRWCGNVDRAHKSNGIFFVVDLKSFLWYQKCYDPECRQYRSEAMPLPAGTLPQQQQQQQQWQNYINIGFDAYNEDDELMVAALEDYEVQQALLNMP